MAHVPATPYNGVRRSSGTISSRTDTDYNDDEYLAQIEQYKNEPFYDYLLTNPWMWSKQDKFSPNLGQQILGAFGDFSSEDNYKATIRSNQQQWLTEALEKFRQEKYNTPIEQAKREIQAGINPDLAGNIDPGSAAENDQPILGHPQFGEDGSLQAIGSFFLNIYTLASGFAKDAIAMQGMMNDLTSQDLDINDKIVSATTNYIMSHIGQPTKDENGLFSFPDLILDDLEDFGKKMFKSRSTRNRFRKEVESSYRSAKFLFTKYGSIRDLESAKRGLAAAIAGNQSFGYDYSAPDSFEPIIKISQELTDLSYKVEKYQSKYSSDYFHGISGSKAAEASNEQNQGIIDDNKARSYQRGMDKIINETMNKIVSDLSKEARNPGLEGLIAKGMLGFISAYRLQLIPSMPSVNLSGLVQSKNFYNTTNNNLGFD